MNPLQRAGTTALVLLLALSVPAHADADGHPEIQTIVYDLFEDVNLEDITFEPGCGGGRFQMLPEIEGFRFHESDEAGQNPLPVDPSFGGYGSTGCGRAIYHVQIPKGVEHWHVRFNMSRSVNEAFVIGSTLSSSITQEMQVLREGGAEVASNVYVPTNATDVQDHFVDPAKFITGDLEEADLVWYFEDHGYGAAQQIPGAASGVAFQSTIHSIQIEWSYIPIEGATYDETGAQAGRELLDRVTVHTTLPQELYDRYGVNVRVRTDPGYDFSHVVLPDGTRVDTSATRSGDGPGGYDPDHVLVENFGGSHSWFTVPYGIVAQQGPGEYTFVLTYSRGLEVAPAIIPFAAIVVGLPFLASVFAVSGAVRFQREAFGGFARAARWLVAAVLTLLAFYVAVVVVAIVTGNAVRMVTVPFDVGAVLLYVEVVLAGIGFVLAWFVARELYRITVPKD